MILRLLLTICLAMGLAAPCAWASTWSEQEINEWKESVTKSYETYTENRLALRQGKESDRFSLPLYKLTIGSYEWMENDAYHIRYTFTNPTDELLETTVLRTDIMLSANNGISPSPPVIKRDPASEWILRVKPHSSITHTITLPKEPAFTHFIHEETRFCLSDGSTLSYALSDPSIIDITPVDIDFRIEPTGLNKGILSLTITNRSSEILHELRNIMIYTQTEKYSTYNEVVPLSAPIPLDLGSNETKTLRIPIPISDHLARDPIYAHYPDLDIDDLRYKYDREKKRFIQQKRQNRYRPQSDSLFVVYPPTIPGVLIFGNMEPYKDRIGYYLTFYNNSDQPQKVDSFIMSSTYEDMFCTSKKVFWSLAPRGKQIRLSPGQIKRYGLVLPLLADTTAEALSSTTIFEASDWIRSFARHPKISAERLHAMQKAVYEPLPCFADYSDVTPLYYFPPDQ